MELRPCCGDTLRVNEETIEEAYKAIQEVRRTRSEWMGKHTIIPMPLIYREGMKLVEVVVEFDPKASY